MKALAQLAANCIESGKYLARRQRHQQSAALARNGEMANGNPAISNHGEKWRESESCRQWREKSIGVAKHQYVKMASANGVIASKLNGLVWRLAVAAGSGWRQLALSNHRLAASLAAAAGCRRRAANLVAA